MNKSIIIAGLVLGVISVLFFGFVYVEQMQDMSNEENKQRMREHAIEEAQQYMPDGECADTLTPALHTNSGAEYTFPNNCLAPGWEAV